VVVTACIYTTYKLHDNRLIAFSMAWSGQVILDKVFATIASSTASPYYSYNSVYIHLYLLTLLVAKCGEIKKVKVLGCLAMIDEGAISLLDQVMYRRD